MIECDCDYKGTVRNPDIFGINQRVKCPKCQGRRLLRLNMTFGQLQALVNQQQMMIAEIL